MSRTRKFEQMQQEALRLSALKMKPSEIAEHLEVSKSTVTRWIAQGKLPRVVVSNEPVTPVSPRMSPAEWARSVRTEYRLDATDGALVTLAESALSLSRDITVSASVQLSAAGRFQQIVRQLALVTRRTAAEEATPAPVAATGTPTPRPRLVTRPKTDPRAAMMGIK